MADFYAARSRIIPPLPWTSFAPPFSLPKISGKSPLAKAIRYALGRMPKTRPYLDNGFLELDNNTAERAMKPVAIGRKNVSVWCAPPNGADFDGLVSTIDSGHLGALYGCEAEEAALAG